MSKTALISALERFDLAGVLDALAARPDLSDLRSDRDLDLLQWCCKRSSVGDAASAGRQVRLAKWLVSRGFNPRALHTTAQAPIENRREMLRLGADPDVPGQDGRTVRQIASRKRDKRYFAALARTERREVAR